MLYEGMPLGDLRKGGEGNALDDYGVSVVTRDGTVRLMAHYTVEIKR